VPIKYIDYNQAKDPTGLRMIVVGGLPSPWGEAAKGIFHIKKIPFSAVYHNPHDKEMENWAGSPSAPVAIYENEAPLSSWKDILLLAERLSPEPTLLSEDPSDRALILKLSHDICGEKGLGWVRRLESVHKGLKGEKGGFPEMIAKYLAYKYGYHEQQATGNNARIVELLNMLTERLRVQHSSGKRFYVGSTLSAIDIYSATFMAYFKPLPAEQCPMDETIRTVFETLDEQVLAALSPILIEHRDFIYSEFLELPLSL